MDHEQVEQLVFIIENDAGLVTYKEMDAMESIVDTLEPELAARTRAALRKLGR